MTKADSSLPANNSNSIKKKTCPQCQTEFDCGSSETKSCWCNDLPKIMPLEENMHCLCPECLKIVIDNKIEEHKNKEV